MSSNGLKAKKMSIKLSHWLTSCHQGISCLYKYCKFSSLYHTRQHESYTFCATCHSTEYTILTSTKHGIKREMRALKNIHVPCSALLPNRCQASSVQFFNRSWVFYDSVTICTDNTSVFGDKTPTRNLSLISFRTGSWQIRALTSASGTLWRSLPHNSIN